MDADNPTPRTMNIDHSIVSGEAWWPHLETAIGSGRLRLVLSVWNLFEIGCASDKEQQARRLEFLRRLNPLWLVERRAIQRQEVERFLWAHKYKVEPKDLLVITPLLSVVDSFFAGSKTRLGLTPEQFIRETDFAALIPYKKLAPAALRTLQSADQITLREKEKEMFDAWIAPSIPDIGPDGRALTVSEKSELLQFCYDHRSLLFSECRALATEDALSIPRTRDPRRQPTQSDGVDLQHVVVALSYCDVFLTADRYQAACARDARQTLSTNGFAEICSNSAQLLCIIRGE